MIYKLDYFNTSDTEIIEVKHSYAEFLPDKFVYRIHVKQKEKADGDIDFVERIRNVKDIFLKKFISGWSFSKSIYESNNRNIGDDDETYYRFKIDCGNDYCIILFQDYTDITIFEKKFSYWMAEP